MSTLLQTQLACPTCGAPIHGLVADSVNAGRAAWVRDNILDGSFHRFPCNACGAVYILEKELLYTDFDRRHFVGVFPVADQPRWQECGQLVLDTFREALFERAAPIVRREAADFAVRVVFGLAELREKLICWELGMADPLLEIVKLTVLDQHPALTADGPVALVLERVEQESMVLAPVWQVEVPGRGEVAHLFVHRRAYEQAIESWPAIAEAHRGLAEGPYVNLQRYWSTAPPPPLGTPRSTTERKIWRASRP
jgi:hypothetical protein